MKQATALTRVLLERNYAHSRLDEVRHVFEQRSALCIRLFTEICAFCEISIEYNVLTCLLRTTRQTPNESHLVSSLSGAFSMHGSRLSVHGLGELLVSRLS